MYKAKNKQKIIPCTFIIKKPKKQKQKHCNKYKDKNNNNKKKEFILDDCH